MLKRVLVALMVVALSASAAFASGGCWVVGGGYSALTLAALVLLPLPAFVTYAKSVLKRK